MQKRIMESNNSKKFRKLKSVCQPKVVLKELFCCCCEPISNDEHGSEVFHLQKNARIWPMAWNTCICLLPGFSAGMSMAFTAPALEVYRDEKRTPLEKAFTQEEGSWFVSILMAAIMLGNLLSSKLSDSFGRKRTLASSVALMALGWGCTALADGFVLVMVSRIMAGVAIGIMEPTSYLLLSEIALVRYRGVLGMSTVTMMNVSWLCCLALFAWAPLQFNHCVAVCAIFPTAFVILSHLLEESPLWMVKQGRVGIAEEILHRLRGQDYPALEEVKEMLKEEEKSRDGSMRITEVWTDKTVRKPVIIMAIMFILQANCGADIVCYYSLKILRLAKLPIVDRNMLACLIQSFFATGYLCSAVIMTRMKRRRQFIATSLCLGITIGILGTCITEDKPVNTPMSDDSGETGFESFLQLVPALCLPLVGFFYGLGAGPICFALTGELFPVKAKAFCSGLVIAIRYFATFLGLKMFPTLRDSLGLGGAFQINSVCCLLSCLFALRFLPETQGLTLTQLGRLFEDHDKVPKSNNHEVAESEKEMLNKGKNDHDIV